MPIGFLNIEQDGLKALGANITSSLTGGTTYLPCLIVGESAGRTWRIRFGGSVAPIDASSRLRQAIPPASWKASPPRSGWRSTITSPGANP